MIKAGPNCFDNIKDLAVAGCVRAALGADRLLEVAGHSDSEESENNSGYVTEISQATGCFHDAVAIVAFLLPRKLEIRAGNGVAPGSTAFQYNNI